MNDPKRQSPLTWLALAVVTAIAAALRAPASPMPYFWNDEAWRVALLRDSGSLSETLANAQALGFWFLLPDWLFGNLGLLLFDAPEWAFRIWPFLFGIGGVVAVYGFVRSLAGTGAGLVAAAFVAVGPGFVYHAREFKPYALDLLMTALCLALAVTRGRGVGKGLPVALHVYALSSLTFVFVYPAIVLFRVLGCGDRKPSSWIAMASPALTFALYYAFFLAPQSGATAAPQLFWNQFYPTSWTHVAFLGRELRMGLDLFFAFGWIALLAGYGAAIGISIRRGDGAAWLFAVPLVANVAFAALEVYPLFGRSGYYLYAIMIMGFAYACAMALNAIPQNRRGVAIAVGLLLGSGVAAATERRDPYAIGVREHRPFLESLRRASQWPPDMGRRTFAEVRKQFAPGDRVLVSPHAYYTFLAYRERDFEGLSDLESLSPAQAKRELLIHDETSLRLCESVNAKRGADTGRIWILASMRYDPAIYRDALARGAVLDWVVREPVQGLARWEPTAAFDCMARPNFREFTLSSRSDWSVHAVPTQGFPRFFQLRLHLASDTAGPIEWRLGLRGSGDALHLSRDLAHRVPANEPRWIQVTGRDFPDVAPEVFQETRALEFRFRSRGERRMTLRVLEGRLH